MTNSSVFSTGGGGINYEQAVQTSFLLDFITQQKTILFESDHKIIKLGFQNRNRTGFQTDDLMIECDMEDKSELKALIQIKHNMPLTLKNEEFQKVIGEFWKDFNNPNFNKNLDKLVIVKSSYTKDENEHIKTIIDWTKTHSSSSEWIKEIETIGAKKDKLVIFKQLIFIANNTIAPTNEELYSFMRCLILLEYDFSHNVSKDEGNLLRTIEHYKNTELTASEVLNTIASIIPKYNSTGGTIDLIELKNQDIYKYFNISFIISQKLTKLLQESSDKMHRIHRKIASYSIDRSILKNNIAQKISKESTSIFVLEGVAGVGKSVLLFDILSELNKNSLYIKAEQLICPTIQQTLQDLGIQNEITKDVFMQLSLDTNFIVVIDGVEKLIGASSECAFQELIKLQEEYSFELLLTCRNNTTSTITDKFHIFPYNISVPFLSQQEQEGIFKNFPFLQNINDKLKPLLAIPKYLDYMVRASVQKEDMSTLSTHNELRENLWERIVLDSDNKKKTQKTAIEQVCLNILTQQFNDQDEIVDDLENREIIQKTNKKWYFTHDIIEDWVVMEYTVEKFQSSDFFEKLNNDVYLQKGLFLWLEEAILDQQDNNISLWLKIQLDNKEFQLIYPWLHTMLVQIFYSEYTKQFYQLFYSQLITHEYRLLFYCMQWINTTCKKMINHEGKYISLIKTQAWNHTCRVLQDEYDNIDRYKFSYIADFVENNIEGLLPYYGAVDITDEKAPLLPCIELASLFLKNHKDTHINENKIEMLVIYSLLLEDIIENNTIIQIITDELTTYKENSNNKVLSTFISPHTPDKIIQKHPQLIVKTMWALWRFIRKTEEDPLFGHTPNYRDYDKCWGVNSDYRLTHPHYSKTIIYKMLQDHPMYAVKFIVEFINYAVKQFLKSECAKNPFSQSVQLLSIDINGITKQIHGSDFIWEIYRASSVSDHLLECLLMALEQFLIELKKKNTDESNQLFNSIVEYIFEQTNNVAPIAVIHSILMMEENISDQDALNLFLHPELLRYDIKRQIDDETGLRWHHNEPQNIRDDLDKSNALPHRKISLRDYIINYYIKLFNTNNNKEQLEQIHLKLDKIKEINDFAGVELNLFYQMDSREWTTQLDPNDPTKVHIILGKPNEEPTINNDIIEKPLSHSAKLLKAIKDGEDISFEEWIEIYDFYKDSDGTNLFEKTIELAYLGYRDFYHRLSKKQKQWCRNTCINNYSNYINSVPDRLLPKLLIPILKNDNDRYFWLAHYILNFINSGAMNLKSEYIQCMREVVYKEFPVLYKNILKVIWSYACEPKYDQFYHMSKEIVEKYNKQKLYFSIYSWKYYFYKHPQKYLFDMLITFLYKSKNVKLDQIDLNKEFDNNLMMEFVQTIPYDIKDLELIKFRENYIKYYIEWYLNNDDKNNGNTLYMELGDFIANLCIYSDENTYRELLIELIQKYQDKQHIRRLSDLLYWSINNIVRVMDHHDKSDEKLQNIYIPRFWELWHTISDNIKDNVYSHDQFIDSLLFNISGGWKEGAKDWFLFEGHEENVDELMNKVTRYGARATLYFLRTIGKEKFMYQGLFWFKTVTRSYQWDDIYDNNKPSADRFIEEIEQKYQGQLQKDTEYREAFIYFLDNMIVRGSDVAYAVRQRVENL